MNKFHVWRCHQIMRAWLLDRVVALILKRYLCAISMFLAAIVLLVLAMSIALPAYAATAHVDYMKIPAPYLPLSNSTIVSGTTFTLPGYGSVNVTWVAASSSSLPAFAAQDQPLVYNRQSSGGPITYTWLTDTQDISMQNGSGWRTYTVTFTFLSGQPDLSRLLLMVDGLASDTTATVSRAGTLEGEYQLPLSTPTAPTTLTGSTVLGSGFFSHTQVDGLNTGWALFRLSPVSPLPLSSPGAKPYFDVTVRQFPGDGIGMTLGYSDPPEKGLLKICKVAGPGVAVGRAFGFTTGSTTMTVLAGLGPGGYCAMGPSFPIGTNVTVTEAIPAGFNVTNIAVAPQGYAVGTPNLAAGAVTVKIGSGVNEITYTDKGRSGFLEICKSGGVKGSFSFTINPGGFGPFVVPAGGCSPAIELPAGPVVITEAAGAVMDGCSTIPASRQLACNTGGRTSIVTIVQGDVSTQTIAVISNRPNVIGPTHPHLPSVLVPSDPNAGDVQP